MIEYIYRDFNLSLMTDKGSGEFLRALALSGGSITCSFAGGYFKDPNQYRGCSMFFRLKFLQQADLDKFHSLGFVTTDPPKISNYPDRKDEE